MAQETSAPGTKNSLHQRTREQTSAPDPRQTEEAAGPVGPVPFERLLSVAALTPGQASLVAVLLLDAAHTRGTVAGEYLAGTGLGPVTFMPTGDIDVGPPGAEGGTCVTELLERLLQNARRLPAHPRPEQLLLLRRLEKGAGDASREPGARAREIEEALTETLGSGAQALLSAQLAALVGAFAHVAPGISAADDAPPAAGQVRQATARVEIPAAGPGRARPALHRPAPAPRTPGRPPRRSPALFDRRGRGRRGALVLLIVAVVLAGGGYIMLHGQGGGVVGALGLGGRPAAPATSAPAQPRKQSTQQPRPHRRQTVPALAGPSAGPITGVELRKTGSCRPGALCPVRVTVRFRPAATTLPIAWKVGAARLCTGGITWSASATVTAQPGWTTVYASSSVRVPKGGSLALVALTTTPARAQSRAVSVTGSSLHC